MEKNVFNFLKNSKKKKENGHKTDDETELIRGKQSCWSVWSRNV